MLKIGCHLSSSKGWEAMGKDALRIGANTFQFFTRNPRGSKAKALNLEDVEKLKNFVKLYSVFDNDMDMHGKLSDEEKNIYDMLKKYKLASSEGLNKHTNRMIRYNVLKDFLCDKKNTDDIQAGLYDKIVNYVEER